MGHHPALGEMRRICLALPQTKETLTWGKPHFRVGEKIFAGYGEKDGRPGIGFKLEMDHAQRIIKSDPRFTRAPYVGHKGWVSVDVSGPTDWDRVQTLVLESFRLIAPKRTLKLLIEGGEPDSQVRRGAATSVPGRPTGSRRGYGK